ncbi:uncharacterized protein LOC111297274 isoform X2 [Durio zibethinus]|uniref:Uncharacterized protein LOC111297274 isoform X2 n=1 Tax=Durio zibethinus TaxID=66656 RepID=A0A6P5Z546_DURZI|nr:uncharacterized protein LOC111297274 isoform X2 [Durio zibethinus]
MKGSNRATVLTLAEKCKNILASSWQGHLNTIKSDAKGSKESIYTSKVKYIIKRGKPYIWVPEHELHNVNTIIDERGSFSVASPFPGPLGKLLRSVNKFPARVALTGDVVPLKDKKAQSAAESLKELILSEEKAVKEFSYTVSGVLSSSNLFSTSRSENLKELIDGDEKYVIYKFNLRMHAFSLLIVTDLMYWERFVAKQPMMKSMNTNGSNSGSHSRKRHEMLNLFAVNLCKWKKRLSKRFQATVVWDKK